MRCSDKTRTLKLTINHLPFLLIFNLSHNMSFKQKFGYCTEKISDAVYLILSD